MQDLAPARHAQSHMPLRESVKNELVHPVVDRMLEPVEFSKWAAPIMPVLKSTRKSV